MTSKLKAYGPGEITRIGVVRNREHSLRGCVLTELDQPISALMLSSTEHILREEKSALFIRQ